MKIGSWAGLLLAAAPVLTGCGDFWQAPGSGTNTDFSLSNNGNITIAAGSTTGSSTISVTPSNSFTGTVSLTCAVTSSLSNPTSPGCSLNPASVSISGTSTSSSTLTVTASSSTTAGAYQVTVTGVSNSVAATTTVCAVVGSSSGSCSSSSGASGDFYILNATSISGYSISSGSPGTLNTLANTTFTLKDTASAIAMSPSGNSIDVAMKGSGITPFTINSSTGALTAGTPFEETDPEAIVVDPSGKWLLDASSSGTLNAYPITSTGAGGSGTAYSQLLQIGSGTVEQGGIAISPNGKLVAVALGTAGTEVFAFNANPGTGVSPLGNATSPIAPSNTAGGAAVSVAFDPQNRLMYIGEVDALPQNSATNNSGGLRLFTISGSTVTELASGSPIASGGTNPQAILPISTGNDVYVANFVGANNGNVTGFTLGGTSPNYTLTALSPAATVGFEPFGLAEDSSDKFVLSISNTNTGDSFSAFTFDATTAGQLDPSATGLPVSNPIGIVAVP